MSPNGLQVQGADRVTRVGYAVDVSVQTVRAAERAGVDFLIVHHGLWWGKHVQITGTMHARISGLIHAGMSLYAAHLPLDCHPRVGNNVELARMLAMRVKEPFGDYRGIRLGVIAAPARPVRLSSFTALVAKQLASRPDVLACGPATVRRVAIVSGGGRRGARRLRHVSHRRVRTQRRSSGARSGYQPDIRRTLRHRDGGIEGAATAHGAAVQGAGRFPAGADGLLGRDRHHTPRHWFHGRG